MARQADNLAQYFGFSNSQEMIQDYQNLKSTAAQMQAVASTVQDQNTALEFCRRCPDFPETDENITALMQIIEAKGWEGTAENLEAAHLLAVRNHIYQPLTQEQIQATTANSLPQPRRNAPPPPMMRGNAPDNVPQIEPERMPLNELRRLAIRQELESRGPEYRP